MSLQVKEKNGFNFVDEGQGQVLMLLHGLFGALSNWEGVVNRFSSRYRVVIPMLPIYSMPIKEAGLEGLKAFVEEFVNMMELENVIIMVATLPYFIPWTMATKYHDSCLQAVPDFLKTPWVVHIHDAEAMIISETVLPIRFMIPKLHPTNWSARFLKRQKVFQNACG
jgi:hypothetical protein